MLRRRAFPIVFAVFLSPATLVAQDCSSVAAYASEIWDQYVVEAREAGCLSPVRGARKWVACGVRASVNQSRLGDRMVGWWNTMADGSWATIGPKRLDPDWQEGTLLGTTGRVWMGTSPVNTGRTTVTVEKLDGVVPTEVVVCASREGGSTREIARYRFSQGRDNIGRARTFEFDDLEADLVAVKLDGKGKIPTNQFHYRIRLTTEPQKHDLGPVPGFADLHIHQAAQLGFGGNQLWGSHIGPPEEALPQCGPGTLREELARSLPLPAVSTLHGLVPFDASLGEGEARHGHGSPGFGDWPHFNDVLHQQVHEDWLLDAHERGLNVAVVSAVNFEGLCYILKALYPRPNDRMGCRDMENVERQVRAFVEMDEARDWYEIAMDPWHARKIIHDGKLAVVISLEVSHLFPADKGPARTQLDRLYGMGLRTLQLAHETDSRFAGAAPHRNLFELFQTLSWPTTDPDRLFATARGETLDLFGFDYDENGKNAVGLRDAGERLVEEMIERHMLIDLAHLSERASRDVYELVAAKHDYYPLYNSHTRFEPLLTAPDRKTQQEFLTTEEQLRHIRDTGGMVGLRTGQNTIRSMSARSPEAVANTCDGSSRSFAQMVAFGARAGIPMGFGSDLNGFINQIGPRFGPDACPAAGPAALAQWAAQGKAPGVCRANPGGSTRGGRDFDTEGLRHVGYLPDLVGDLETLDTPGIDVLKSSAEAFLRMWERAWDGGRRAVPGTSDLAARAAREAPDWFACDISGDRGAAQAGLGGNWLRVGGNNPANDGMRMRIEGSSGTLTHMPPAAIGGFRVGQEMWKEIAQDGTLEVVGSDGRYYDSKITWDGPHRFHLDIDRAASPGNDQTWDRAGPSIDGEWRLTGPASSPDAGIRVQVEGTKATIKYLGPTSSRWLRTGTIIWREIRGGGLEAQVGSGRYAPATIELRGDDTLVLDFGKGVTQTWTRGPAGTPRPGRTK